MIRCPPYISSTCPFKCPKYSCCREKYFWDRLTTKEVNRTDRGMTSKIEAIAISQLTENIIIKIPVKVTTEVMIWAKL